MLNNPKKYTATSQYYSDELKYNLGENLNSIFINFIYKKLLDVFQINLKMKRVYNSCGNIFITVHIFINSVQLMSHLKNYRLVHQAISSYKFVKRLKIVYKNIKFEA